LEQIETEFFGGFEGEVNIFMRRGLLGNHICPQRICMWLSFISDLFTAWNSLLENN